MAGIRLPRSPAGQHATVAILVRSLVFALGQAVATFVFATHDPQVMGRARRLIRLVDGRIDSDERRAPEPAR